MKAKATAEGFLAGKSESVDKIREVLRHVPRRFNLDRSTSEELVQEALGRIFIGLAAGRFRGEASLKTYAERVGVYTCLEHLRRIRRTEPLEPAELKSSAGWSDPEGSLERKEKHQRNLRVFASLSADCRGLFYRVFVEGRPYREVAAKAGVTESAIKLRVFRCRQRVREALEKETAKSGRNLRSGAVTKPGKHDYPGGG